MRSETSHAIGMPKLGHKIGYFQDQFSSSIQGDHQQKRSSFEVILSNALFVLKMQRSLNKKQRSSLQIAPSNALFHLEIQ